MGFKKILVLGSASGLAVALGGILFFNAKGYLSAVADPNIMQSVNFKKLEKLVKEDDSSVDNARDYVYLSYLYDLVGPMINDRKGGRVLLNGGGNIKNALAEKLNKLPAEQKKKKLQELLHLKELENREPWLKEIVDYIKQEASKENLKFFKPKSEYLKDYKNDVRRELKDFAGQFKNSNVLENLKSFGKRIRDSIANEEKSNWNKNSKEDPVWLELKEAQRLAGFNDEWLYTMYLSNLVGIIKHANERYVLIDGGNVKDALAAKLNTLPKELKELKLKNLLNLKKLQDKKGYSGLKELVGYIEKELAKNK